MKKKKTLLLSLATISLPVLVSGFAIFNNDINNPLQANAALTWSDKWSQDLIPEVDSALTGWTSNGYAIRKHKKWGDAIQCTDDHPYNVLDCTYTYTLQTNEKRKADAGQLTAMAQAWYWAQTWASMTYEIIFSFETSAGTIITDPSYTMSINGQSSDGTYSLRDIRVPKNTRKIYVRFRNANSLAGRPTIQHPALWLYDATPAKYTGSSIDDSKISYRPQHIAITGDRVTFSAAFNEAISSVVSYGSYLMRGGFFSTSDAVSTSYHNSNGYGYVDYTFQIPQSFGASGTLRYEVTGLQVKDEAGNVSTVNTSYNPGDYDLKVTFYKAKPTSSVSFNLDGVTANGNSSGSFLQKYTCYLSTKVGYRNDVSITVGGYPLNVLFSWGYNQDTGGLWINGEHVTDDIVITAKSVPIKSTVNFNQGAGEGGTTNVVATFDAPMPEITLPTLKGHVFKGYFTGENGTGTKYYSETGASVNNFNNVEDITLYALWEANSYAIKFDTGDGEGGTAEVIAKYGQVLPKITFPSKVGYKFVGYYADRTTESRQYYDGYGDGTTSVVLDTEGDLTLYAVYTPIKYSVKFDVNLPKGTESKPQGTMNDLTDLTYDSAPTNLTKNTYSLTGYDFKGWAIVPTGDVVYLDEAAVDNLTAVDGTVVNLYAVWEPWKYSVVFNKTDPLLGVEDTSGVGGVMANMNLSYDQLTVITDCSYTYKGYHPVGWATEPNGEMVYVNQEEIKNLVTTDGGIINLYVVWEANKYTIEFNKNTPINATSEVQNTMLTMNLVYNNAKVPLLENTYTLNGWVFKGWSTSPSGPVEYNDKQEVQNVVSDNNATCTLYAIWEQTTYYINFDANKPSDCSSTLAGVTLSQLMTYDSELTPLTANGFSFKGWTFAGWATEPNGEVIYTDKAEVKNLSSNNVAITLYAKWTKNSYTVTYVGNVPEDATHAVEGTMNNSSHFYDEAVLANANNFTLYGWTFLGWSTTSKGDVEIFDKNDILNLTDRNGETITLYAVWGANEHIIYFNNHGGKETTAKEAKFDKVLPVAGVTVKSGYQFLGYFTEPNGMGLKYYDEYGSPVDERIMDIDDNITLHAHWTPIMYTINLYSNGNYIKELKDVIFGELVLPNTSELNLTRENYTFMGWNIYDEQDWAMFDPDRLYKTGLVQIAGEQVDVYAAWKENPIYSVTYDANGGSRSPMVQSIHELETLPLSLGVPFRQDHTFLGWSEDPLAEVATYNPGDEFTMGTNDIVLYAVWKINPKISYNPGKGAFGVSPRDQYQVAGQEITLTYSEPTLYGYKFVGWSREQDSIGFEYGAGDTIPMFEADTVLYAIFQKDRFEVEAAHGAGYEVIGLEAEYEYQSNAVFQVVGENTRVYANGILLVPDEAGNYTVEITRKTTIVVSDSSKLHVLYDNNGGLNAPIDLNEYEPNATTNIKDTLPIRSGYDFLGWSTDPHAEVATYQPSEELILSSEDVNLYAVWSPIVITIHFHSENGLDQMTEQQITYDQKANLNANTFEKEGYTFVGWALFPESEDVIFTDKEEVLNIIDSNSFPFDLYAVYEETVTTIAFDIGGARNQNSSIQVQYGSFISDVNLLLPLKDGYVFEGYYTEPNGLGELVFDQDLAISEFYQNNAWTKNVQNATLYPTWRAITYKVIYIDGNNHVGRQDVTYGDELFLLDASTLTLNAPQGKHFVGWSTRPNSSQATYDNNQEIIGGLTSIDKDTITLYAAYANDASYRVRYDANGGTNAPVDMVNHLIKTEVSINQTTIPTKEGYIFAGWAYDPSSETIDFPYVDLAFTSSTFTMPDNEVTLFAIWTPGETLQSQIDEINGYIDAIIDQIDILTQKNIVNEDAIEELTALIAAAQQEISALDGTYATDAELASAVETLELSLANAIEEINAAIDVKVAEINQAIGALTSKDTALDADIAALTEELANAKAIIAALDGTYATDAELTAAKEKLTNSLANAVEEINAAIDVKVAEINQAIEALNSKDTALDVDIAALTEELAATNAVIEALDGTYATDAELTAAKEELATVLATAREELTAYVDEKADALQALIDALEAKDVIHDSDLADLAQQLADTNAVIDALDDTYATDAQLAAAKETLEVALATAKEDLTTYVDEKAAELQVLIQALQEQDVIHESDITALTEELAATNAIIEALDGTYATDAQLSAAKEALEAALATAKEELTTYIDEQVDIINTKIGVLEDKDATTDVALAELNEALSDAKAAIDALNDTYATDAELASAVETLNTTITNAKSDLKTYIDTKITAVNQSITALENEDDITDTEIAALNEAIENAQAAIDALDNTFATDAQLNTQVIKLNNALNEADRKMKAYVDTKVSEINEDIELLKQALKDANSDNAYELNRNIRNLEKKLSNVNQITNSQDSALEKRIKQLEKDLDETKSQLRSQISENDKEVKDTSKLYMMINAVVASLVVVMSVVLIIKSKNLKKIKK